ncbi:MAG: AAA family ATPase, partial [Halobacteriota archaeon]
MKVVATVGLPGSGKSVFEDVAGELDVPVVSMGDVIRREVARRGLDPSDVNMGRVAVDLREKEGGDVV